MKKLVLMAAAIVAVSFASCGNKAANAEQATADSIRIADSIAAVEAAAAEAAAAAAATTNDNETSKTKGEREQRPINQQTESQNRTSIHKYSGTPSSVML